MTPKQRKFADEYLIDLNATRAYKAAYPKVKTDEAARANGSRLLTNANVQSYVEQRLNEISSAKLADAKEVMEYLTSVLRGESSAEIVVIENIGDYMSEARTMNKAPDEKERLKAAELLGKRYGLFTDKLKVDGAVPVVIRDDLPEDDE
jgi:phage terminase small subunit